MKYLLGIDLGTSGTKAALFDESGRTVTSATSSYQLLQPQNGWAEQDPRQWWQAVCLTTQKIIADSKIAPASICGVGMSGQMHGLVMLDANGDVLRNAILWCDGRTGKQCAEITSRAGRERLISITANPALAGFTAGKVLWVRENEPELYARCRHILLPKDYLRWQLCGTLASEPSDASGTNLFDVPKRQWSQEMLQLLDIDPTMMPQIFESHEVTGHVTKEAARLTGLQEGTPVVGGAGDNAAAAIGNGVIGPGQAFTTIGTSGVIFSPTDKPHIDPQGRVHTFCHALPGRWVTMSCTLAAGLSLQWFKNTLCAEEVREAQEKGVDTYQLLDNLAAAAPIGSNRLLYMPYLMGERSPLLDEQARGAFIGLSAMHGKKDMLRAVMEGVTFSQRQCLDVLRGMGISPSTMLVCGGGGNSPFWRQMIADVYSCPVATIPSSNEGAALGAAILAGVGTGVFKDAADGCARAVQTVPAERPCSESSQRYEPFYQIFKKVYPAIRETCHSLAEA